MLKYTIGDRVNTLRERRQNDEILRSHVRIGELERVVAVLHEEFEGARPGDFGLEGQRAHSEDRALRQPRARRLGG